LSAAGPRGEASWAALGGKPYAHTASGWQEIDLPGYEDKVAAIAGPTAADCRYLISGEEVLCCDAAGGWRPLPLPEGGAPPVDLCLPHAAELLCLDGAGVVWRLDS